MGNSGSRAPALLGKTHVPYFEWKIHCFSALLETKATSAFHCSGYHASHSFDFKNFCSDKHCLIPLHELLKSSAFLVDDSCVFGVEILKIDVSSPEKKVDVVQKKATTVQNLFVQKKGFINGTYTWVMNNFLELDLKRYVRSPTFEVGGHKWRVRMYPHGDKYSTDCLSLNLYLHASNDLPPESGMLFDMTIHPAPKEWETLQQNFRSLGVHGCKLLGLVRLLSTQETQGPVRRLSY